MARIEEPYRRVGTLNADRTPQSKRKTRAKAMAFDKPSSKYLAKTHRKSARKGHEDP